MIQVRNVPDKVHQILRIRAIEAGMSLSEYLLREITRVAEMPTKKELIERLRKLPRVEVSEDAADIIRQAREERDEQIWPLGQSRISDKP
jgi:plasmid stability protein